MARNELYCYFRNNFSLCRDDISVYINEKLPNDIFRHLDIFFNDRNNKVNVHYTVYMGEYKIADTMLILMNVDSVGLLDNSDCRDGFDAIVYLTFRTDDDAESRISIDLFYKSMDEAKKDLKTIKSLLGEEK